MEEEDEALIRSVFNVSIAKITIVYILALLPLLLNPLILNICLFYFIHKEIYMIYILQTSKEYVRRIDDEDVEADGHLVQLPNGNGETSNDNPKVRFQNMVLVVIDFS